MTGHDYLHVALQQAKKAYDLNEVPVGAVIVYNNEIIGTGFNQPISQSDPTAHAEIVAIREASRFIQNYRLVGASLYVTLEPCAMCVGAIVHARIKNLVYGAIDPKAGAVSGALSLLSSAHFNHQIQATYLQNEECGTLLRNFFKERR